MAILSILKNTATQAVAKITGSGSATVDISALITTLPKKVSVAAAGDTTAQMDVYGLTIGAAVVDGTLFPTGATITMIKGNTVTFSAAATNSGSQMITFTTQTPIDPRVHINRVMYSTDGTITVTRDGADVLALHKTGDWLFTDFAMTEKAESDITVNISDNGTCILVMRKVSGYGDKQGWFGA